MTERNHRVKWFVYVKGEKFRHEATMRGYQAWDAECSCGWRSATGGALKWYVTQQVKFHKFLERVDNVE